MRGLFDVDQYTLLCTGLRRTQAKMMSASGPSLPLAWCRGESGFDKIASIVCFSTWSSHGLCSTRLRLNCSGTPPDP
jgi:hypothetical protein